MKQVLEERGINTATLLAADMRVIDSVKPQDRKHYSGTIPAGQRALGLFIPKFHCELNSIESQAKVYSRAHTNFTARSSQSLLQPLTLTACESTFERHVTMREPTDKEGKEVEQALKVFKSHRRFF